MVKTPKKNTGANLGFKAQLWFTADKLRGNMEPSNLSGVEPLPFGFAQGKYCLLQSAVNTDSTAGS